MILGMGAPELIVILIVVLVIFGPKNLPKLGSALGKTVKNVREGMEGDEEEASDEAEDVVEDEDRDLAERVVTGDLAVGDVRRFEDEFVVDLLFSEDDANLADVGTGQ